MESTFAQLIALGVFAAAASVLGTLPLILSTVGGDYRQALRYLLALGAGFMLAVTLFEVLPKSIMLWSAEGGGDASFHLPMALVLAGYLMTQFFEHTLAPHFHLGEEMVHDHVVTRRSAVAGIAGLSLHAFFDGIAIAAASMLDVRVGLLVLLGIVLHKFPEGLTIGSLVLASGRNKRAAVISAALIGAATPLGIAVFYLIGTSAVGAVAYALPVAAGVTLYVAASDLVPEVNHHGGGRPAISFCLFGGVGLFFLVHLLVQRIIEQ